MLWIVAGPACAACGCVYARHNVTGVGFVETDLSARGRGEGGSRNAGTKNKKKTKNILAQMAEKNDDKKKFEFRSLGKKIESKTGARATELLKHFNFKTHISSVNVGRELYERKRRLRLVKLLRSSENTPPSGLSLYHFRCQSM